MRLLVMSIVLITFITLEETTSRKDDRGGWELSENNPVMRDTRWKYLLSMRLKDKTMYRKSIFGLNVASNSEEEVQRWFKLITLSFDTSRKLFPFSFPSLLVYWCHNKGQRTVPCACCPWFVNREKQKWLQRHGRGRVWSPDREKSIFRVQAVQTRTKTKLGYTTRRCARRKKFFE